MPLLELLWSFVLVAVSLSVAGVISMIASRLVRRGRDRRLSATRSKLLAELTQPDADVGALARLLCIAARNGSLAGILLQVNGVVRGRMRDEYFERLAQSGAIELLAELALRADRLGQVRAIEALSAFPGDVAQSALASMWRAPSAKVRYAALDASVERGAGPPFETVLTMALRAKATEAQLAAGLLRRLTAKQPADALFWLDRMDVAPRLAKHLIDGLGGAPVSASLVAVLSRIAKGHAEAEVRAAAVGSLARLRAPDAVATFCAALDDEAWIVRVRAVTAIGKMRVNGLRPALSRLLDDSNWWVRQRAAEALSELAGAHPS